jgi:tetratricopeptide (TPR) repeat protein
LLFLTIKSEEKPLFKPHEKNATYPGLAHESSLKYMPLRVSHVCLRSSLLHAGNALSALGRDEEARVEYSKALPILANEPRAARLDSERASFYVNIGNTYSRQGNVEKADENYTIAEKLGQDHMDAGNKRDGLGVVVVAKRARAFCFNRNGREEEGKALLREVLKLNLELDVEMEKYKEEMKKVEAKQVEEQQQQAAKAAAANKAPAIAAADAADPAKAID